MPGGTGTHPNPKPIPTPQQPETRTPTPTPKPQPPPASELEGKGTKPPAPETPAQEFAAGVESFGKFITPPKVTLASANSWMGRLRERCLSLLEPTYSYPPGSPGDAAQQQIEQERTGRIILESKET